jgi:hypothetical protein
VAIPQRYNRARWDPIKSLRGASGLDGWARDSRPWDLATTSKRMPKAVRGWSSWRGALVQGPWQVIPQSQVTHRYCENLVRRTLTRDNCTGRPTSEERNRTVSR